ncbi:hypothetical protein RyT2_22510 [Pseudolactococcus yaeyamensis]
MDLTIFVCNKLARQGLYYLLPCSEDRVMNELFDGYTDEDIDKYFACEVIDNPFKHIHLANFDDRFTYPIGWLNQFKREYDDLTEKQKEHLDDFASVHPEHKPTRIIWRLKDFLIIKADSTKELFEKLIEMGHVEDDCVKFYQKNPKIFDTSCVLSEWVKDYAYKGTKAYYVWRGCGKIELKDFRVELENN